MTGYAGDLFPKNFFCPPHKFDSVQNPPNFHLKSQFVIKKKNLLDF